MHTHVYVYIYIYREREREREIKPLVSPLTPIPSRLDRANLCLGSLAAVYCRRHENMVGVNIVLT